MGRIAQALATWYGYKTLGGLLEANFGLIVILAALICVTLVFIYMWKRQFATGPRNTFGQWLAKVTVVFFISAFVFVCAFTLFYEKKKMEEQSAAPPETFKIYKIG